MPKDIDPSQPTSEEPTTLAKALGLTSITEMFGDLANDDPPSEQDANSHVYDDNNHQVNDSNQDHEEDDAMGQADPQDSPADVSFEDDDATPAENDADKRIAALEKKLRENEQKQAKESLTDNGPQFDTSGLEDDEVDEIEIYKLAGQKNPDHKEKAKALADWYQQVKELEKKHGDDYDFDDKFEELKKAKPLIPRREFKKREAEFYSQDVISETTKSLKEENEKLQKELARLKSEPALKSGIETFSAELSKLRGEDLNPIEKEAYQKMEAEGKSYVQTYLELAQGTVPYNPEDQTHSSINQFVIQQAELFSQKGGDKRIRDGKKFAAPTETEKLSQPDKYWTWDSNDIVRIITRQVNQVAKTNIEKEYKRLESLGIDISPLRKKGNSSPQNRQNANQQPASPKVKTSPSQGAGSKAQPTGPTLASAIPSIFNEYKGILK